MSMELAVKHARRSLRWALVAAVFSTALTILQFFSTASRWFTIGAAGYAVFMWATFFLQRRAYRAAFSEPPANVR